MSRAVARLCATQDESRVSLFELVDEMETREQQLLQSRAQLRHTLKTLHIFTASRITEEAANPAFYTYDTKVVSENVLRHLTDSLAQLIDSENFISIEKFITDMASPRKTPSLKLGDDKCAPCSQSQPRAWLGQCTQRLESRQLP